jgi:hypothetical protein
MPELTGTMFKTAQRSNAGEPDDSACFREAGGGESPRKTEIANHIESAP